MPTTTLQARIANPALVVPGAIDALQSLHKAIQQTRLDAKLLELINLRASQINGCGVCALQHPKIARNLGETDDRLRALVAWRDAPFFTDAERAALALTEAATHLTDTPDPVPDNIWDQATHHYDEPQLAGLVMAIASINAWNRLNVATRQVAGAEW